MQTSSRRLAACTLLLALATAGCSESPGTVEVSIWGEAFVEQEIGPARGPADEAGLQNGWTVTFTRFLVHVADFTVASSTGAAGGALPGGRAYDLHTTTGSAAPYGTLPDIAAGRMDRVSFRLVPPTTGSVRGNATEADLAALRAGGFSVYVEGQAARPGRAAPVTFRWGFTNAVRFERCAGDNHQPGLAIPSGGTARAQITVHGDHFFYDSLVGETDPLGNSLTRLRFDALAAADANNDHEVTLDELAAVDLTTLPTGQYGTGSLPGVNSLRDFVTTQVNSLGHFNGEGECQVVRE